MIQWNKKLATANRITIDTDTNVHYQRPNTHHQQLEHTTKTKNRDNSQIKKVIQFLKDINAQLQKGNSGRFHFWCSHSPKKKPEQIQRHENLFTSMPTPFIWRYFARRSIFEEIGILGAPCIVPLDCFRDVEKREEVKAGKKHRA